ncbi:hypothetical protein AC578_2100 [Pseudocercospora eumusae]|uniref:Uncharacterized protein n=1 Tax=Pseudocercospora eumusae TaxID=321146 RepID=A0A139HQD7_9PEZI|nr:hypothetical protein AC578_2100 [Pseudocercospora eumusae]
MAPASSVSSTLFATTSAVVIALLVLLLIRHYLPLRSTPAYLLLPVFLALFLPASIIILVPVDLASVERNGDEHAKAFWLPERALLVTWRITYWLTFILTWFLLPFLAEYCDSGYRDAKHRSIYSLRANFRYQLIVLASGIAGLVYFIWQNGFHAESIKGLAMALAYAWGLILGLGLMGHGLVALPRRLFKNAKVSNRLRWLHSQAPKVKDKLDDASDKLEQLENTLLQLKRHKGGASREQQLWIDELAETSSLPDMRPGMAAAIQATAPGIPAVVTDRYLADLTRKLKRARHRKARFLDEWDQLVERAWEMQTILDAATSKKLDFGRSSGSTSLIDRLTFLTPSMRFYLHMNVIPVSRIAVSAVLGIMSIFIVWSELVKAFAPSLSIIGISVVHGARVNFGGQLIAAVWLLYMDTAALYAIADVKVWGNRALVKRQTYAESACWYSLQVAKLTVPLSYNFITMMPDAVFKDTMFFQFLGKLIQLTPLGQGFSAFFPCFLLLPVLATLFNLYGKTKSVFGFGVLEDESDENPSGFGTGGWREGKALVDRELQSRGTDGTLGLDNRDSSLDLERGSDSRLLPNRSPAPPREDRGRQPAFRDDGAREANRQFNAITNQEEPEDDSPRHFYQDIGERMKNTFDTADAPDWMKNIGSAFKSPKWMQTGQRDDSGGSAISRWFGGRPEDGRLRL